jgi:hypothetical protein
MNGKEIDNMVCEIMAQNGPDGHIDGHEMITSFILAVKNNEGAEWREKYLKDITPYFH